MLEYVLRSHIFEKKRFRSETHTFQIGPLSRLEIVIIMNHLNLPYPTDLYFRYMIVVHGSHYIKV